MTDALNLRFAHIELAGTVLTMGANPNFCHAHSTTATALAPFNERSVPINAEIQACLNNTMQGHLTPLQARTAMVRHLVGHLEAERPQRPAAEEGHAPAPAPAAREGLPERRAG